MMTDHVEEELISALLDGELLPTEVLRTQAHLDACASCRAQFQDLKSAKSLLSGAPRRTMPPGLIADLEARLLRPSLGSLVREWFALPRFWVPSGAIAAAALILGFWMGYRTWTAHRALSLETLLVAHSRYAEEGLVPHGGVVVADLSDQLAEEPNEGRG